jgi:hypothetical protein
MGTGKLNIWVSDVANPCGTWQGGGKITIFDCDGILEWPCGRYMAPDGSWQPVPGGKYKDLPFKCGHLEVEVPPGCYWAVAGQVNPGTGWIHLNYTTHVGIVGVGWILHASSFTIQVSGFVGIGSGLVSECILWLEANHFSHLKENTLESSQKSFYNSFLLSQ